MARSNKDRSLQFLSLGSIGKTDDSVGQITPVSAWRQGNVAHARCHQGAHFLADVITQQRLQLFATNLLTTATTQWQMWSRSNGCSCLPRSCWQQPPPHNRCDHTAVNLLTTATTQWQTHLFLGSNLNVTEENKRHTHPAFFWCSTVKVLSSKAGLLQPEATISSNRTLLHFSLLSSLFFSGSNTVYT